MIARRKLGDTVYDVYPHGMLPSDYEFQCGIFIGVPITHFDHIKNNGNVNPTIAEKKTKLPINFEDE